ncbi:hypothetical protein Nwi_1959 [Nitrobacter winogradskyi Nb-255]|uniref:Uncharacterized protein n=1 Tax=Nitrobacter winogradskyi (strain ATCC 25391 / DSM 10237 / CIP 104748 / NCIMB 11846 / Nb-255) TaxID=323098 RepID=Q3SR72_NITWN|nr:hypothetical protein Nwi_1959 [Nitrobacter winogradskyi Nb-255]
MPSSIDRKAADLLLSVIETPDAAIRGSVLDGYYGRVAPALKEAGILQPKDHLRAAVSLADHEDEPINLTWSPEHRAYGYFSPTAGWVSVPGDQLATFRVNFSRLLDQLVERLDLSPRSAPVELVPDLLWEVGDARLPGRSKRTPVWIGRRLGDPAIWKRFIDTARKRPAPGLRIVLSFTPGNCLPTDVHLGHTLIAVRDVADHYGLAVVPDLLAARVAAGSQLNDDPITMAADGASLTVRGTRYAFSGSKQRAIIRQLYDAWKSGHPELLTAEVLESAGFSTSVNTLGKAFSGRSDWREFLNEEHGRCWMFL